MPSEIARLNTYLLLVEKGLRQVFDGTLKTHPVLYKSWLREKKAVEWIEDEVVISGFQSMPEKNVGGPFTIDRPYLGAEKAHTLKTYGLAFTIEHEALKWDQYGKLGKPTKAMARSGVDRKNILAYAILNNSTDSSASAEYLIYNSEALCASSHVLLRGGTGKNAPTSNLGLSYTNVQSALTDLAVTENEDGIFAVVNGEYLVVPPALDWEAREIINSAYRNENANRAFNSLSGSLKIHSAPYLTSSTRWWILADKERLEAAFSIGEDLRFRRDYVPSTWNSTFSMYLAARVEVLTWPGFWGTDGV